MSDGQDRLSSRPAVFTIPAHRSFADSLVAGIIQRFGNGPLDLAKGRILLPNNRAVRTLTEAFVRASGAGLILPRLIPIGDPDLEERIGGALEATDLGDIPPAIDPLQRLISLASSLRATGETAGEALRLARGLGQALDALLIEEVAPSRLRSAVAEETGLAAHWEYSLARFQAILEHWPRVLAESGRVDLAERRNLLLSGIAERWKRRPPPGFTIAAGITTSAPAVSRLLRVVATMPGGIVVIAGLQLAARMTGEDWDALGPDEVGRREESHPQYHLKLLLDRMGIHRDEVQLWRNRGRSASPPSRSLAVANAMASAESTGRWQSLPPSQRRLSGLRVAELPTVAAEAQAIALALREAIETPGATAALVTPDRDLARRVSALLDRWGIQADDSAGNPLSGVAAGTLLLAIAAAAAEDLAPVPLLALLKHPLVGGTGDERLEWLDDVRALDLALRGPRPAGGIAGLDRHFSQETTDDRLKAGAAAWNRLRRSVTSLDGLLARPLALSALAERLAEIADRLTGGNAWRGADGRSSAELLLDLQAAGGGADLPVSAEDALAVLRELLDLRAVRPAFGGHPRIFIWGALEARLQHADLMVLGGLNEGSWPALVAPDPWLPPAIRSALQLPGLEFRIGLSAHDFAEALGAPRVLITRSRRDSKAPTVASRFWLRLQAMAGGLVHDVRLERLAQSLDEPAAIAPAHRPKPCPPAEQRPRTISVTAVDRLKADPFAFYAQSILKLRKLDAVDADHTAAWKGTAVHKVLEDWLREDAGDPDRLLPRARAMLGDETIHPMLRALWQPRLIEAIAWIAQRERSNRDEGRRPLAAEKWGEAEIGGAKLKGKADRIDRLQGGGLAIVDYKTGQPPKAKAVASGFALQLGLLGMIARAGGFEGIAGRSERHEYWSLAKWKDSFGRCVHADKDVGPDAFVDQAERAFAALAADYLVGTQPFTAKLHPAFAPYGDYDQLMRLEEWYGRE